MQTRFCRYELRTTNVAAAATFYSTVLGNVSVEVAALPEAAVARGAVPHWLGHIGVDDVEGVANAFVERGGARLGPRRPIGDGGELAIVRDPGGAVVAVATPPKDPPRADVVWHQLLTTDLARATKNYHELFGWHLTDCLNLGALGVHQQFSWRNGSASVGSVMDIAGLPNAHPHWLFHFRVAALEPALAAVKRAGGAVIGPTALPSGDRIAVCDDPQGAAFALRE